MNLKKFKMTTGYCTVKIDQKTKLKKMCQLNNRWTLWSHRRCMSSLQDSKLMIHLNHNLNSSREIHRVHHKEGKKTKMLWSLRIRNRYDMKIRWERTSENWEIHKARQEVSLPSLKIQGLLEFNQIPYLRVHKKYRKLAIKFMTNPDNLISHGHKISNKIIKIILCNPNIPQNSQTCTNKTSSHQIITLQVHNLNTCPL